MSAFITAAILGVLIGYVDGIFYQKRKRFLSPVTLALSFLIGELARHEAPDNTALGIGLILMGVGTYATVLALMIFFDDDDRRKRFKKKTSEALEKLLAKVKELAPTPVPKPLPA